MENLAEIKSRCFVLLIWWRQCWTAPLLKSLKHFRWSIQSKWLHAQCYFLNSNETRSTHNFGLFNETLWISLHFGVLIILFSHNNPKIIFQRWKNIHFVMYFRVKIYYHWCIYCCILFDIFIYSFIYLIITTC